jgi:hypothetical protein
MEGDPMAHSSPAETFPRTTYKGFASVSPRAPARPGPVLPPPRPSRRKRPVATLALLLAGIGGLAGGLTLFPGVSTFWTPFESLAVDASPPPVRSVSQSEAPALPQVAPAPPASRPSPVVAAPPPAVIDVVQPAIPTPAPRTDAVHRPAAPARPMPVHMLEVPCDARESAIARLTCRDPQLWGLDRQVDAAFSEAMRTSATPGEIAAEQEAWITHRDQMAQSDPDRLERLYHERLRELWTPHHSAPAVQAPEPSDQLETPSE